MTTDQPYRPTRMPIPPPEPRADPSIWTAVAGGDGGNTKRIVGPVSLAVPQGSPVTITPADDSPRWLKIARDAVWTVVGLLVIAAAVLFAVAANNASNAFDDLSGNTSSSPSSGPAPAICYLDASDPSCPPGFDPGN